MIKPIVKCNYNPDHLIDLNIDPVIRIKDPHGPAYTDDPLSVLRYVFICDPCSLEINKNGLQNWNINYKHTYTPQYEEIEDSNEHKKYVPQV